MGTGHSIDTPIRVAPFGISSVISLVDDLLMERIRKHYCQKYDLEYVKIPRKAQDGRALRTTAYLEMVAEIVQRKFEEIKSQPFFQFNDKQKYFELLPEQSPLKEEYKKLLLMEEGQARSELERLLTNKMRPGSIDVNIMVKLDRINYADGKPMSDEYSDAKAALRGYGKSSLCSSIIFSAGINQKLFGYMSQFKDFYRNELGEIKKKIILKVSDFRSALIQGKFLAKKGLEVYEFRVESGLNCGGHAFPSNGLLLPCLLQEFKEKRDQLKAQFAPLVKKNYEERSVDYIDNGEKMPLLTVQGGIGTYGESARMLEGYGFDATGWASPFLLVSEATCIDNPTVELLKGAGIDDVYLSGASPLKIPFNNVRNSGSESWTKEQIAKGNPGSSCPKGFLVSNTEFTELPICHASKEYQQQKLVEIEGMQIPEEEKGQIRDKVLEKACICDHLGNGALIALGIMKPEVAPQSICPGPNIAWFDRTYSLQEMVDHIYGRNQSLVSDERPHMFVKEIEMYVEYFQTQLKRKNHSTREIKGLQEFYHNLKDGIEYCLQASEGKAYRDENLTSIKNCVEKELPIIEAMFHEFETRQAALS